MHKINRTLIAIFLFCIAFICIASNLISERLNDQRLLASAEEILQYESDRQALLFNRDLRAVETTTENLVMLVESSFDDKAFAQQEKYLNQYTKSIEKYIENSAQNALMSKSAYVFFAPEMDQKAHDVWFADLDSDGIVERQASFPIEYYDGDIKWKQWYYTPFQTRKPFWTEPYVGTIEADQGLLYFSYTAPIIINDKVIGVAGADYYFNQMRESISRFNMKGTGYAVLVDQNFNVLIHPNITSGVNLLEYENGKYSGLIDQLKKQNSGLLNFNGSTKEDMTFYYNRLDNGWYLMFGMSQAEISLLMEPQDKGKWIIFAVGMIITAILMAAILNWKLKPLHRILTSVRNLGRKELVTTITSEDLNRKDELGDLSQAVEALRVMLSGTKDEQEINQEELANLVQEQTMALQKTNEFLEFSLGQLQEQNADMNIANEKYDQQLVKLEQLQMRLFESEQLASLAYMLVGLAYDLNSPIGNGTTMVSYLKSEKDNLIRKTKEGILRKTDLDEFTTMLGDSLDLLERNLAMATNQVVQFKRLSSGQTQHLDSDFRVKEVLHSIFNQSVLGTTQTNIRLNLSIPDINVCCDMGAFIQVFSNLIRFSLNYSYHQAAKGMIHIKCERISEDSLMFLYEDFGNNIPQTLADAAFVPYLTTMIQEQPQFVQLNICYHIIGKVFDGSIKYEIQSEAGNRFFMILKMKIQEL